jgi:hypothetical protein
VKKTATPKSKKSTLSLKEDRQMAGKGGKGGKDDKGKKDKGKKKGKDKGDHSSWSDTVAVILKRDCAEALYAALVIALGTLPTPKKKKKKKKDKGKKGKDGKGKNGKGKDGKGKDDGGKGKGWKK